MFKLMMGTMVGFAVGMGMMMTPAGRSIRRDVHRGACAMKRWLRTM